ncbi:hypothetical protein SRB5_44150 [Streptomyces sp. RB5]|uniref:MFS transporter n=1 Tax=Streptomyces smaragdinus TaxID=2585196 RepID=A0A7K0CMI7_9ACTN|nr:MFS transporter [Streptomyces smaragdinus]MQY14252.1 hypothetical protein [Streptomyces smaragdinus]
MKPLIPYLTCATLARTADEGVGIAVVLLAQQRTHSAGIAAAVLAAWMAPHVVAAPAAGALAARVRRPAVFYRGALAGFAVAVGALTLCVGQAPLGVVLGVAVAGGACGPAVTGGLSSVLAELTGEDERARAYGLDAATYNVAGLGGPALVTLVAALAGAGVAGTVLAAAAGAAAVCFPRGVRAIPGERAPKSSGLRALWRIRPLRAVTAGTTLAFVGVGGLTLTAVQLEESRGYPGAGGVLLTVFAGGALAGALAVARRPPRAAPPRIAAYSLLGTGAALAGAAVVEPFAGCAALFAVAGFFDGPLLTATLRIRADHAPAGVRTQVFTLGAGFKITAAATGAALTGVVAGSGPATVLLGIAALQGAAAEVVRRA